MSQSHDLLPSKRAGVPFRVWKLTGFPPRQREFSLLKEPVVVSLQIKIDAHISDAIAILY